MKRPTSIPQFQTWVAWLIASLAGYWLGARTIWWENRSPRTSIFDFSELCIVVAGIVAVFTALTLAYSSLRLLRIAREEARSQSPPRSALTGPVTRAAVLVAVAWVLVGIISWHYFTPAYARLVPEPSSEIPAGETVTFAVETNLPLGVGIYAERAYRPQGECGTDNEHISAEDGDSITIEACEDDVGVIRVRGFGVVHDYQLGEPPGGREVTYHGRLTGDGLNRPMKPLTTRHNAVYYEWRFTLEGTPLVIKALDWISAYSEQVVLIIVGDPVPLMDRYFMDVYDSKGMPLVRLDFEQARRIAAPDLPSSVQARMERNRVWLNDRNAVFVWGPCQDPWQGKFSTQARIAEKSSSYTHSDTPTC